MVGASSVGLPSYYRGVVGRTGNGGLWQVVWRHCCCEDLKEGVHEIQNKVFAADNFADHVSRSWTPSKILQSSKYGNEYLLQIAASTIKESLQFGFADPVHAR